MEFQELISKLMQSKEFEDFKKENPDSYPFGGFFSIDLENKGKNNQYSLDYFIPSLKKAFSFKIEEKVEKIPITVQETEKMLPIGNNYSFKFKDFQRKIEERMQEENSKEKIQKILYSLQNLEKEDYLLATVFLSGLKMIQATIKISNKEITKFEKKGFLDFLKILKK